MTTPDQPIASACIDAARHTLSAAHSKIRHCLNQLNDDHVNWRPFEAQNSIANIVLHLCGNVRQWIISGIGGTPDVRHRPSEFSDRKPYTRDELLHHLQQTVRDADEVLSRVPPDQLAQMRRIQGFDETVVSGMW